MSVSPAKRHMVATWTSSRTVRELVNRTKNKSSPREVNSRIQSLKKCIQASCTGGYWVPREPESHGSICTGATQESFGCLKMVLQGWIQLTAQVVGMQLQLGDPASIVRGNAVPFAQRARYPPTRAIRPRSAARSVEQSVKNSAVRRRRPRRRRGVVFACSFVINQLVPIRGVGGA